MKSFEIFYRVPATAAHGTYLSSTREEGATRDEAAARVAKRHPEYTEVH
jgi:hypothetical protein